jgi:hypothetical protein
LTGRGRHTTGQMFRSRGILLFRSGMQSGSTSVILMS